MNFKSNWFEISKCVSQKIRTFSIFWGEHFGTWDCFIDVTQSHVIFISFFCHWNIVRITRNCQANHIEKKTEPSLKNAATARHILWSGVFWYKKSRLTLNIWSGWVIKCKKIWLDRCPFDVFSVCKMIFEVWPLLLEENYKK